MNSRLYQGSYIIQRSMMLISVLIRQWLKMGAGLTCSVTGNASAGQFAASLDKTGWPLHVLLCIITGWSMSSSGASSTANQVWMYDDDHSSWDVISPWAYWFITVPLLYYSEVHVMFLDCIQTDKCWMKTSLLSRFIFIFCDDIGSLSMLARFLVCCCLCWRHNVFIVLTSGHTPLVCCHMWTICVAWLCVMLGCVASASSFRWSAS